MSGSGRKILVAIIGAAHGVRGEVRLKSLTADPLAVAGYGPLTARDGRVFEIAQARHLKDDMLVVRLKGVDDRNAAERLTRLELHIPRERLPEPEEEDEFYLADLIGLAAVDESGAAVGRVAAVQNFGADDLLEIAPAAGGPTFYLAFTKANVPAVDLAGGRLVVVRPEEVEGEERGEGRG